MACSQISVNILLHSENLASSVGQQCLAAVVKMSKMDQWRNLFDLVTCFGYCYVQLIQPMVVMVPEEVLYNHTLEIATTPSVHFYKIL
jgi:hypothetical protein